jgi:hypothetical protein
LWRPNVGHDKYAKWLEVKEIEVFERIAKEICQIVKTVVQKLPWFSSSLPDLDQLAVRLVSIHHDPVISETVCRCSK